MKHTKLLIILILMLFSFSLISAQQGKYVRKSVSSLESVWFKPGSVGDLNFDSNTFNKFIDYYIEIDRFDYNVLPADLLENFRNEANSLEEVSSTSLSGVLEKTVINRIVEILNDPEVMQNRGQALKDEAAFQTFAATKAKSLGLTVAELETLMNSAYIYLPYIQSATKETGDKSLSITLKGGVIWWKLKISSDGNASVEKVLDATTTGISSLDPTAVSALTKAPLYTEFKFGAEKWPTTPEQYAQNDAMLAFCKNLGVKTKEIDDFKLSAQIVEADGKKYGFGLGHREGVHLDDGFHIVEIEEDALGNEVAVRAGFVRVSKTGDNAKDPNDYTYANQLLGKKVSEGAIVMEHPRLGMDARFNLGIMVGSSIKPEHTSLWLAGGGQVLAEEATTQIAGNLLLSYNLAPIIGVTQTFLDLDIGFSLPMAEYDVPEGETASALAFVLSPYLGVTKKFGGQLYYSASLAAGLDVLSLAGTYYTYDYTYGIGAIGVKLGGEVGFMINQDLSVTGSAGYKIGMVPMFGSLTVDDVEYEIDEDYITTYYDDLKMGGLMINIGASYALGELPINVFGFLDPFKKY
ncbi:hypothetical protein HQ531_03810 [bacterium]|nr:hypothetical protein [bacterium]